MDKRTETMAFRCTPELKTAIEALAEARKMSASEFLHLGALEVYNRELLLYQRLRKVFGANQGLSGLSGLSGLPDQDR